MKNSGGIALKILYLAAWSGTVFSVLWLLFSYLLPEDLSNTGPIYSRLVVIAFFGRVFTFQMGLALLVAAVLGLIARRRRLLAVAAITALVSLSPSLYACRPHTAPSTTGSTLRIMSMNLMFDSHDTADVLAQIQKANPDVIILEEYEFHWDAALHPALEKRYPFTDLEPRERAGGLAVYSKQPFHEPVQSDVRGVRSQIRVVINIDNQPVAIYAVHPLAPLNRWAIIHNRLQVLDYLHELSTEKLPTIMAGDWNFPAETANARALHAGGLTDAFDIAGFGRGSTWPVLPRYKRFLPGVRIDHIYLTSQLTCTHFANGEFDGSDHLPILADVGFFKR